MMQSCDNTAWFEDSDSYSVTISNSYVWSGAEPPRVVVYYTSDLSLTLKDIALFSKKEFTGMTGLANHLFQIAGLEPFTEYQIYVFVEEASGSSTVRPLVSNRVLATTYGLCTDGDWPAVCSGSRRLHDPGRFGSVQVGVREREIAAVFGLEDRWMDGIVEACDA